MRERRRSEDERPDASHAPVVAPPATRAELVARLQRGAGNARVSRMIAQELERPGGVVPAHEPGDRSEDLLALGPGAFGEAEEEQDAPLRDVFAHSEVSAAPSQTTAPPPAVDPEITKWLALQPASNEDLAKWLLAGETHGFITFRDDQRPQMADLGAGKDEVRAYVGDRSALRAHKLNVSKTLGVLTTLEGLTRARARRWVGDPSKPKSPVATGDLIRNLKTTITDAHAGGASADLFPSFDWTGPNGPAQVIQVLQDLPKGTYTIGLPMQGDFFPESEWLAETQKALAQDALQTPPSLVYWQTVFWKSTRDPSQVKYPWKDEAVGGLVVTHLKSAALKTAIAALKGQDKTLYVMPDYPNHIHITRH